MSLSSVLGALGGAQGAANILQGAANVATNIYNTYQKYKANEKNLAFQKFAQQLNQANTMNTWNREDSAVQRRVADLRSSGLSPTLAAGSAASSSQAIRAEPQHSEAPQFAGFDKVDFSSPVLSALATAQDYDYKAAQIGMTEEQKKLIQQQILESQSRSLVNQAKVFNLDANTAFTKRNTSYFDTKQILANAQMQLWQQQRSLMQSQEDLNFANKSLVGAREAYTNQDIFFRGTTGYNMGTMPESMFDKVVPRKIFNDILRGFYESDYKFGRKRY